MTRAPLFLLCGTRALPFVFPPPPPPARDDPCTLVRFRGAPFPTPRYLKSVSGFNCRSARAVASFAIIIIGVLLAIISAYSIIAQ